MGFAMYQLGLAESLIRKIILLIDVGNILRRTLSVNFRIEVAQNCNSHK